MLNETNGNYLYGKDAPKILFLDIETFPSLGYFYGNQWRPFMPVEFVKEQGGILCWQAKWAGSKEIIFDAPWKKGSDKRKMIQRLWKLLDQADVIVHYYGKKFDIPHINTAFLINQLPPPSPYKQIDLKEIISRTFKFPSGKLKYVSHKLEVSRKLESGGVELFLKAGLGDVKAREEVEVYGKGDIPPLEDLYNMLLPWIRVPLNLSVFHGELVCPRCGSENYKKNGSFLTPATRRQRYLCKSCDSSFVAPRTYKDGTPAYFKPVL